MVYQFAQALSEAHVAMQIRKGPDEEWRDLHIPNSVRAIIMINLQTYMGGCDLWGMHEHHMPEEQAKNLKKPIFDDGLIEVILSCLTFSHCCALCWHCSDTAGACAAILPILSTYYVHYVQQSKYLLLTAAQLVCCVNASAW